MDLNRATILGRLTQDPELKNLPSGQSVCTFSVATNRTWTDNQGQKQEQAEFHNIVMWGKLAEVAAQYLKKGGKVYLEGRLQTRSWDGDDGKKRYRTEIVANNMIMLSGPSNTNTAGGDYSSDNSAPSETAEEEIKVEDIPF